MSPEEVAFLKRVAGLLITIGYFSTAPCPCHSCSMQRVGKPIGPCEVDSLLCQIKAKLPLEPCQWCGELVPAIESPWSDPHC